MKVLVLAAGYGTRLSRDLQAQGPHGQYSHLVGVAKPLLPIGGTPLISHWMALLGGCSETQGEVYVVVNDANYGQFESWARDHLNVRLVSDGSTHNESRSGAVACIELSIRHFGIQDDLLVIAGDTLFFADFSLSEFIAAFHSAQCGEKGGALVSFYQCKDQETSRHGILEVGSEGLVTAFLEKPSPDATTSRRACPAFYLFSRATLPLISQFLLDKKSAPLVEKDAPGNLIKYLCSLGPVFAKEVKGRFDIGNLDSYRECCKKFTDNG